MARDPTLLPDTSHVSANYLPYSFPKRYKTLAMVTGSRTKRARPMFWGCESRLGVSPAKVHKCPSVSPPSQTCSLGAGDSRSPQRASEKRPVWTLVRSKANDWPRRLPRHGWSGPARLRADGGDRGHVTRPDLGSDDAAARPTGGDRPHDWPLLPSVCASAPSLAPNDTSVTP